MKKVKNLNRKVNDYMPLLESLFLMSIREFKLPHIQEAWDILETIHEATFAIKRSRIIRLDEDFVQCQFEEDQTFEKFYARV